MKSFDQAAQSYESFGFIQREMAAWLAKWRPFPGEGMAVEAGAGTGFFTRHLLPWNGRIIATDASPSMVAQGAARWPQLEWRTARAEELPDVAANWIFSSSFLQWTNHPVALLRHWKSRLNSNGRILAGLFVAPTLAELDQVLPETTPLHWRSPAKWSASFRKADLTIVREEAEERVFCFRSGLELLRTLHGVGAAPERRISAAGLRKAIRDYDRRFQSEGGVTSTWTFYRIEAAAGAN